MRIAHVTIFPKRGSLHANFGGVAGYSKNLITSIPHEAGDEVFVLCNMLDGVRETYREQGMTIRRCFNRNIKAFFEILKEIGDINPDTVHVQHEVNLFGGKINIYLFLLFLALLRKKKVVVTLHNVVSPNTVTKAFMSDNYSRIPAGIARIGFELMYRPMALLASRFIVHSDQFKQVLVERYKYRDELISVIPHGVEDLKPMDRAEARKAIGIDGDETIVLYMGYATGYKGLDYLIDGFADHSVLRKKSRLILAAGKHPTHQHHRAYKTDYSRLDEKAGRLLPNGQCLWLGYMPEEDIVKYFSAADAVIFPYVYAISSSGPMSLAIGYEKPILLSSHFQSTMSSISDARVFFNLDSKSMSTALDLLSDGEIKAVEDVRRLKHERLWKKTAALTHNLYK